MSLVTYVLPWTLAVYTAVGLLFGAQIFDASFADNIQCSGIISCVAGFFDILVGATLLFFNLATLGGFTGILPLIVQGGFLLGIGLPWFLVWLGVGRGTQVG